MSKRISDHDIERLLAGATPEGRPELADVAASLAEFRSVAHEAVPQPSAALMARLDLPVSAGAVSVAVSAGEATALLPQSVSSTAAAADAERSDSRGITKMFEWIAGLGLAAKITAGTGALALSLAGVGAAGALPGPLQEAFDSAVSTTVEEETTEQVVVEDEVVEDGVVEDDAEGTVDDTAPTGSDEFSSWVQEGAQSDDKVGAEFGAEVSEQAQELREEKASERGEAPEAPGAPEQDAEDDETDDSVDDVAPGEGGKP